jgi:hypothetical protein
MDIDRVRHCKEVILTARHRELLDQLAELRRTGQVNKIQYHKQMIHRVRALAREESVDLGDEPELDGRRLRTCTGS